MRPTLIFLILLSVTPLMMGHPGHSHSHSHSHDNNNSDTEQPSDVEQVDHEEIDDILAADAPIEEHERDMSLHHGDDCLHDQLVHAMRTTHKPRYAPQTYAFNLNNPDMPLDDQKMAHRRLMSLNNAKYIRIVFDYTNIDNYDSMACNSAGQTVDGYKCTSNDILSSTKKSYLKNTLLPAAKAWIQAAYKVVPVSGGLKLSASGGKCYKATYNTKTWYNADLVLVVTARPIEGTALAWATSCQYDQLKRPVAGHINFGPKALLTDVKNRPQQVGVAIHEIAHVQGFSAYALDKFIDSNNNIMPKSSVRMTTTLWSSQHTIYKIKTPKVIAETKKFFGCSSVNGLQLEDGGSSGSAGSHWDKRLMLQDYMSPTASADPRYSRITFAFFEDSGHYKMDYSATTAWNWGQNKGCSFLNDQCGKWPASWGMTCKAAGAKSCTFDRKAKGVCALATYSSSLPKWFQYFSDPKLGGHDKYADYCPFIQAYSNGDCTNSVNAPGNTAPWGEAYNSNSRCFQASLLKSGYVYNGQVDSRCYEHKCASNGVLQVKVASSWVNCPAAGGAVSVSGYQGTLMCPAFNDLCTGTPGSGSNTGGNTGGGSTSTSNYYSPSSSVNARNGPGTSYTLLFSASTTDVFLKTGSSGSWFKMQKLGGSQDGNTVWIHSGYLTQVTIKCPTVNGLSMRTGPSTSYTRIWSAKTSEAFTVVSSSNGWNRVYALTAPRSGTYAWASSTYLKTCAPTPGSSSGGSTGGGSTTPTQQYWLSSAGGYTVNKIDRTTYGSFTTQSSMNKFLLETTEGLWPSNGDYEQSLKMMDNMKRWAHFIVAKDKYGSIRIAQLLPFNKAGSYLDAGNWAGCIQVMVGAKASKPFTTYDSQLTAAVKALYQAVSDATGIPRKVDYRVSFKESGAYGYNAPQRLDRTTFYAVTGLVGQQHAYSNRGWSPGAINPSKLM